MGIRRPPNGEVRCSRDVMTRYGEDLQKDQLVPPRRAVSARVGYILGLAHQLPDQCVRQLALPLEGSAHDGLE